MTSTAEYIEIHKRKLNNRINSFSGKFMSNAKWLKLFKALSFNAALMRKCYVQLIWDNINELSIPAVDEFSDTFNDTGIKDIMMGGPSKFKEIQYLSFPASWKDRRNAEIQTQDITQIREVIEAVGTFEIEIDADKLIVYGYR